MPRFKLTTIGCAAALVLALGPTALAQELVDNPQYTSWAKYKPGTTVVMKMTTKMGDHNMNGEVTQTLKDIKPDAITIEVKNTVEMMGQKQTMPAQSITIKSKVSPAEAKVGQLPPGAKADVKDVGKEALTVGGKSYDCTVAEVTGEAEGTKTKGKLWRNDDVPGQMVKMEMAFDGAQSGSTLMELVSVDAK